MKLKDKRKHSKKKIERDKSKNNGSKLQKSIRITIETEEKHFFFSKILKISKRKCQK